MARCPKCRYRSPRPPVGPCPVCGHDLATPWRTNEDRADRYAMYAEWIAAGLGWVLVLGGAAVVVLMGRGRWSLPRFRIVWVFAVVTLATLFVEWRLREPLYRILLVLGIIWLGLALLFAFW